MMAFVVYVKACSESTSKKTRVASDLISYECGMKKDVLVCARSYLPRFSSPSFSPFLTLSISSVIPAKDVSSFFYRGGGLSVW